MVEILFIGTTFVAFFWTYKLIRLSGGFAPWLIYGLLLTCGLIRRLLIYFDSSTASDPGLPIVMAFLVALFPWAMYRALK